MSMSVDLSKSVRKDVFIVNLRLEYRKETAMHILFLHPY